MNNHRTTSACFRVQWSPKAHVLVLLHLNYSLKGTDTLRMLVRRMMVPTAAHTLSTNRVRVAGLEFPFSFFSHY